MQLTQEEKKSLQIKIEALQTAFKYFLNDEISFEDVKRSYQGLDIEFYALSHTITPTEE